SADRPATVYAAVAAINNGPWSSDAGAWLPRYTIEIASRTGRTSAVAIGAHSTAQSRAECTMRRGKLAKKVKRTAATARLLMYGAHISTPTTAGRCRHTAPNRCGGTMV